MEGQKKAERNARLSFFPRARENLCFIRCVGGISNENVLHVLTPGSLLYSILSFWYGFTITFKAAFGR